VCYILHSEWPNHDKIRSFSRQPSLAASTREDEACKETLEILGGRNVPIDALTVEHLWKSVSDGTV
jgi:hypothetical protein